MSAPEKSPAKDDARPNNKAEAPTAAAQMYVLDTTARPGKDGSRTHDMVVQGIERPFTFEYGKPLALPKEIALKFLKHDAFRHTDADGNVLDFQRTPKQPEELGAGERFALGDNETIARFDELATLAMQNRCAQAYGGEKYANSADRAAMVDFLKSAKPKLPKILPRKSIDGEEDLLDYFEDEDAPVPRARERAA